MKQTRHTRAARVPGFALLLVLAAGVAPSAASASSMTISTEATVKTGTHPFSVSGTADQNAFAFVRIFDDAGTGCPANSGSGAAAGGSVSDEGRMVQGDFAYSSTYFVNRGGAYLLCGYVQSQSGETLASATAAFRAIGDTDGDGVYDDQDRCPNEHGVDERTGQTTADGCPIRDGDRDGVRDDQDRCPGEPGTDSRTGAYTADGCPVRDGDRDGVVDASDRCPTEPGTAADGCTPADSDSDAPDAARTFTNNLFERKNGVVRIQKSPFAFTVRPGTNSGGTRKVVASMTVSVNAATKSRYRLTSAVIMRGSTSSDDITPPLSGGVVWRVKSTKAVAKKLKGVKTLKGVTYKLRYTSPVTETVTRKVDLHQYGTTANSNVKLVRLSSSGDTHQEGSSGRGGGRG